MIEQKEINKVATKNRVNDRQIYGKSFEQRNGFQTRLGKETCFTNSRPAQVWRSIQRSETAFKILKSFILLRPNLELNEALKQKQVIIKEEAGSIYIEISAIFAPDLRW